jgi:hypothetical protein
MQLGRNRRGNSEGMEAVGEVDLDKIFEASRDLRKEVSSTAEKERGRGKEDALTFPDLVLFLPSLLRYTATLGSLL